MSCTFAGQRSGKGGRKDEGDGVVEVLVVRIVQERSVASVDRVVGRFDRLADCEVACVPALVVDGFKALRSSRIIECTALCFDACLSLSKR